MKNYFLKLKAQWQAGGASRNGVILLVIVLLWMAIVVVGMLNVSWRAYRYAHHAGVVSEQQWSCTQVTEERLLLLEIVRGEEPPAELELAYVVKTPYFKNLHTGKTDMYLEYGYHTEQWDKSKVTTEGSSLPIICPAVEETADVRIPEGAKPEVFGYFAISNGNDSVFYRAAGTDWETYSLGDCVWVDWNDTARNWTLSKLDANYCASRGIR